MSPPCLLRSLTAYVPHEILTNQDLEAMVETSDAWIKTRTGIEQRHRVAQDENASAIGLKAAREALATGGISPGEITHIITATTTPDYLSPSTACIIGGMLGTPDVMAFDFSAACSGFIYGMAIAQGLVCSNTDARVLFICTEALTRRINWKDRNTCVLFGDAATACVLDGRSDGAQAKVIDVLCQSDGTQKDLITVGGGTACRYRPGDAVEADFYISMQGRDTYRRAVRCMVEVSESLLKRNGLTMDDVDIFIPHQANMRIIEAVGARLKCERVFTNVACYGNTSAASIPLALCEAYREGKVNRGDLVLVSAFGAGLTWGAALLRF